LNWHLSRGHVIIPSTFNPERLKENFNVYDFKLKDEEYDGITALDKGARMYDPKYYKEYDRDFYPYFD
jgi:2,5-diketo-D-gluconate reductase A